MTLRIMDSNKQILIVDDEEDICLMVSSILRKAGYSVEYCTSIMDGKEEVLKRKYQAFFLDLNLPDGSGFDLIPLIKENSQKDSKIIVISAYDGHLERERAEAFGVDAFIHKPFNKGQILDVLSKETE